MLNIVVLLLLFCMFSPCYPGFLQVFFLTPPKNNASSLVAYNKVPMDLNM